MRLTVSVCLTVHARPPAVLRDVLRSVEDQGQDETVVVLDRSPRDVRDEVDAYARRSPSVRVVPIYGPSGWRDPAPAWNRGFAACRGALVYALSSETVQSPGNVQRARRAFEIVGMTFALYGRVDESDPTALPGNLCSSQNPNPLGFTWAVPRRALALVGGYCEDYADGQASDDLDMAATLWAAGLHFAFWDSIRGVHRSHDRDHERPDLLERNAAIFRRRHPEGRWLAPERMRSCWVGGDGLPVMVAENDRASRRWAA